MNGTSQTAVNSAAAMIADCWNKIGVRGDGSCPELEKHIHCRNCPTYTAAASMLLDRDLRSSSICAPFIHYRTGAMAFCSV